MKSNEKKLKWYVATASSGQEKKVAELIRQRVKANALEEEVPQIIVPTQEKIVIKRGKKTTVEERIYPGYILIQMKTSDEILHLIRNTEGVVGFIGAATKKEPTPLSDRDAKAILAFMEVTQPATYQTTLQVGDAVKIEDGAFKDFVGTVQDVNLSKGQVSVLISMFGRDVPVSIDILLVNKI